MKKGASSSNFVQLNAKNGSRKDAKKSASSKNESPSSNQRELSDREKVRRVFFDTLKLSMLD